MSQFLTTLKTEQLGKWQHRLLADLILDDDLVGLITVPRGFLTDFATLDPLHNPILFPGFALVSGYGNYAATVHDWLYSTGQFSRKVSDGVFYRALRAEGVAQWRAGLFWAGVRAGGAAHYANAANGPSSPVSRG
ncbi:DUF1353 domain-containing protein [Pseudomonas sp. RIT-To-2]|uniref:DUF1353 domain-containing protein n=1 Tax=Pseudomonas sp. RIT-To-2 TaxID=3462541 RepID=UPI002412F948